MKIALLALAVVVPFAAARESRRSKVAILSAIHGGHLKSKRYPVDAIVAAVRRYRPEVVLVEVPPDLYEASLARVDRTGFATTRADLKGLRWIGSFPEIYAGVLPLRQELGYTVVPVSGWTPAASADRREFWKGAGRDAKFRERRQLHDLVAGELEAIRKRENANENPAFLNSRHYADLRRLERTLWAACFDEGLGRGGEVAINRAHFARIAAALDEHRGKRVLIVYGAAHRYWFERELLRRDDVELTDITPYLR